MPPLWSPGEYSVLWWESWWRGCKIASWGVECCSVIFLLLWLLPYCLVRPLALCKVPMTIPESARGDSSVSPASPICTVSSLSCHCPFPGLSLEWLLSPINGTHNLFHPFLLGPTSPEDLQAPHTWIQLKQLELSLGLSPTFISEILYHFHMVFLIEPSPNPQNHLVALLVSYGKNRSPLRPVPVGGEVCRKDSSQTLRVI